MKRPYQLLLLAVIVLTAYYPAAMSGFSNIDDADMAKAYQQSGSWDPCKVFLQTGGQGLYYRPVLALSFLTDRHLLSFDPGLMHLENILIHLCNAFLVFYLTMQMLPAERSARSAVPFLAALLFAVHPVNTETVNWISGRTDSLACFFLLLSTLSGLHYARTRNSLHLGSTFFFFLLAVLTKETALAFLPGLFLLIRAADADVPGPANRPADTYRTVFLVLLGIAVGSVFFFLRAFVFSSNMSNIGLTIMSILSDPIHSMFICLRSFGFYLTKLVFPYPLNFAILEVDPFYEILAVPLVVLTVIIATRRSVRSALFTTGILLITPSFLLAFGQIAWTPYAERYVYISSGFLLVAGAPSLQPVIDSDRWRTSFIIAAIFVSATMLVTTFHRSTIWQNDLTLCRDTIEQSPQSKDIRAVYGMLLARNGDYDAALVQLEAGKRIPDLRYDERFDIFIAYVYDQQGRLDDAIQLCETALNRSKGSSRKALRYLIALLQEKRLKLRSPREKALLDKRLFSYNLTLFRAERNPRLLYDLGKVAEQMGDTGRARIIYRQAMNNIPRNDLHQLYARIALNKLEKSKNGTHVSSPE